MRFVIVLCLLLVACGTSSPAQSDVAQKLNGAWHTEDGTQTVFDFDQRRATITGSEVSYMLDRVDGYTVFLNGTNGDKVTVRLIGDDTAEWRTETAGPFILTKGP